MQTMRYVRRALLALLIGSIAVMATPAPAQSACVVAYVVVYYEQAPDQVLVDPSQCLVPTPFPDYPLIVDGGNRHNGYPLSPGMPAGAYAKVWIPL